VILPGQSIQAAVNANPGRTTFWLKAGLYSQQSVIPKTGNTFLADSGAIMDGGNVVSQAFSGTADSVTIRNLTVQHYNTPLKAGAIQGDWNQSVYWVVQNCDIGFNHAAGLYTTDYMLASNNAIHDNGQIGILGKANFATFTGNEVYGNNTGGNDPNDEAGAMKILQSSGVRFAGNWVHNNHGQGIWFDGSNQNALIENNLVTNNENAGIFYEISYGAIIRNNVVTGNGGTHSIANGAILVSASSNVEVYGNTVSGNNTGIVALQANRGSGVLGTYLVTNLWVHNNTSTLTTQCSGIIDQIGDKAVFSTTRNNRFDSNTYSLGSLATPFCGPSGAMTKAQWQAAGYDVHSTFK
jgi:parallel beta-helix repeat protein